MIRDKRKIDASGGRRDRRPAAATGASSRRPTPDGSRRRADGRAAVGDAGERSRGAGVADARPTADRGERPSAGGGRRGAAGRGADRPLGAELEALRSELDERTARPAAGHAPSTPTTASGSSATGRVVGEQATGTVLAALLPVLDDLDRAREHGDLVGPFARGGRAAQRGAGQVRPDRVRREGRRLRPDPARGGGAPDLGRGHRADLRRRSCAAATCSASGCCARPWSPWPTRNDDGDRASRPPVRVARTCRLEEEVDA